MTTKKSLFRRIFFKKKDKINDLEIELCKYKELYSTSIDAIVQLAKNNVELSKIKVEQNENFAKTVDLFSMVRNEVSTVFKKAEELSDENYTNFSHVGAVLHTINRCVNPPKKRKAVKKKLPTKTKKK